MSLSEKSPAQVAFLDPDDPVLNEEIDQLDGSREVVPPVSTMSGEIPSASVLAG
jgi:hypothetical protein